MCSGFVAGPPEPEPLFGRKDEAAALAQREAADTQADVVDVVASRGGIEPVQNPAADVRPPQHSLGGVPDRPLAEFGVNVEHAGHFHHQFLFATSLATAGIPSSRSQAKPARSRWPRLRRAG